MKKSLFFIYAICLLCPCAMLGQATGNLQSSTDQSLNIQVRVIQDASCIGCNDAIVEALFDQVEGVAYSIEWNTSPIQYGAVARGLGAGFYVATISSSEGQEDAAAASVVETLSQTDIQASVKAYPNPSQGNLNLEFTQLWENANMDLFNLVGQKVLHKDLTSRLLHSLDLSDLDKGVYLMKITLNSLNKTITKRIVLN
ncbi:MAG: T9SS type A sorting domain-containing protein [Bacteroidota bacterium]